jgi:hypothetical protein
VETKQADGRNGWLYALAMLAAIAVVGLGLYLALSGAGWAMLAAGAAGVIAVACAWPIASLLYSAHERNSEAARELRDLMNERLQQICVMMNQLSDQQVLSDRAKSIAYRDKDREALRRAIQEEIAQQDWEAALVLVEDMEAAFGYRQEAERFREEIGQRRQDVVRRQIAEVTATIERHARGEQWPEALNEAQRLAALYPDNEQARRLPQEVEQRRDAHKQRLIDGFRQAIERKDVDGGIELLKQLDSYLSSSEAEAIQGDARALFREKLNALRQQFAEAVHQHRWSEALRIGDEIIRDFPNSGIAREVREKMDALRQRANEPAPAEVGVD